MEGYELERGRRRLGQTVGRGALGGCNSERHTGRRCGGRAGGVTRHREACLFPRVSIATPPNVHVGLLDTINDDLATHILQRRV